MDNIIKIKEYKDDGDMGYDENEAIVNLKRFVSITNLGRAYRKRKLLQVGTEKIIIDFETADMIWDLINE